MKTLCSVKQAKRRSLTEEKKYSLGRVLCDSLDRKMFHLMLTSNEIKCFYQKENGREKKTCWAIRGDERRKVQTKRSRRGRKRVYLCGLDWIYEKWNNIPHGTQTEINGRGPCEPSLTS